jgi:hypothetical protein
MIVTAEQVLEMWAADTRRRGLVPTVMPSGPNTGKLAERYVDPAGFPRYALAPADVERVHQAIIAQEQRDIDAAVSGVSGWLASLPADLVNAVLSAPRNVLAGVLGVPPWVITFLALGAVVYVGRELLPRRRPANAS